MKNKTVVVHICILLLLGYLFLFHAIGDYSLKEPDEGRYAEIPREMIETGEFTVPYLNNVRYFEKPPLFYWAVAASYRLFGVSEWSFRFPNALSAFACIIVLYLMMRRWSAEKAAFLSSVILLSSFGFFAMARVVTLDMFFTLWLLCALMAFMGFYREKKRLFLYAFYIALGLATLTKGPVSVILVGATVFIFLFIEKDLSFIKELKPLRGLAVYAAVTLPWIIAIALKEKEFLYFFFVDQHILRFFTSKHKRSGPVYYFFPVLFAGLLPWSVLIPRGIAGAWKVMELRFFVIWTVLVFSFFSLSGSKLPPYILPVFPALAILIGHLFHVHWDGFMKHKAEIFVYVAIFAVFALSTFLPSIDLFRSYIDGVSRDAPGIMRDLRGFSVTVSVAAFIFACLLFVRKFRRLRHLFWSSALFSLCLIIAIIVSIPVIDRLNTVKQLAVVINKQKTGRDIVINYASYDQTLPFYTRSKVIIASYKGELEMGSRYDDARAIFMNEDDFLAFLNSSKSAFIVLKEKKLAALYERTSQPLQQLVCASERCLIYKQGTGSR